MSVIEDVFAVEMDLEVEEKRIARVIGAIQKTRSRACFQNILSYVNRENKDMDMNTLKDIINVMMDKKVIFNRSKDPEKESFKLFQTAEGHTENGTQTNSEHFVNGIQAKSDHAVEDFDEENLVSFYDTLKNMIKDEVKSVLREKSEECSLTKTSDNIAKDRSDNDSKYYLMLLMITLHSFTKK